MQLMYFLWLNTDSAKFKRLFQSLNDWELPPPGPKTTQLIKPIPFLGGMGFINHKNAVYYSFYKLVSFLF